ncbi:hypothetical protein I6F36_37340 [Bradyrhizobium sp. BRP19]|uniref:hypothetical protein n=1 Tax=Bradyrhizobium sp. BRP19 TaxID=2793823 RepID=UPI001CD428E3|nr:hypothetical protein [Bradyrhizobium sp. BRP19]MCA1552431.1 hypothetical protein [Bradyrhizobium sp. BRP19]
MGSDIAEQLDTLPGNRNRTKTNLFGQGYTDEGRSTIGCSVKGKIWSYEMTNNFSDWIDWSREVGRKLIDDTITTDGILRNLVRPKKQTTRPPKPAIAIAWPDALLLTPEDRIEVIFGDRPEAFYDFDIDLTDHETEGPIRFSIRSGEVTADFELIITPPQPCSCRPKAARADHGWQEDAKPDPIFPRGAAAHLFRRWRHAAPRRTLHPAARHRMKTQWQHSSAAKALVTIRRIRRSQPTMPKSCRLPARARADGKSAIGAQGFDCIAM